MVLERKKDARCRVLLLCLTQWIGCDLGLWRMPVSAHQPGTEEPQQTGRALPGQRWSVHGRQQTTVDQLHTSTNLFYQKHRGIKTTLSRQNCFRPVEMLAAHHDQENLVLHQPVNGGKPAAQGTRHLQPKTPGARYPKTPLKVPLNDENAARVLGGKSVIGGRSRAAGNEPATAKGKGLAPVTPLGAYCP